MKLSAKHGNQATEILQSFAGGLNTSLPDELIDKAQLAQAVNVELDITSGVLRTVRGTIDLWKLKINDIREGAYDVLNDVILLFTKTGTVYAVENGVVKQIGVTTGDGEIIAAVWEDGLLIASGGHLQYAKYVPATDSKGEMVTAGDMYALTTITTSPADCSGVFIRSGRVLVFDSQDNFYYSGVGDEEYWEQDTNDPSTSLFLQIGYKVGGKIIGVVAMQSYVLIIKDNGMIFRLENEYPDWNIKEVTRNGYCKGPAAFTSIGSNVLILGADTLQTISPTDDYGNMPINYVGNQIKNEIASLPPHTRMRYVSSNNQLWFVTNSQWVLILDCNTNTFFQRYFNSDVVDVLDDIIIKRDRVCRISSDENFEDNGEPLQCRITFKTDAALHDILVKGVSISYTPFKSFFEGVGVTLNVGKIVIPFPERKASSDRKRLQNVGINKTAYEPESSYIYRNENDVFLNEEKLAPGKTILVKKKQNYRAHRIPITLTGEGFPFAINFIAYDRVEV